MKSSSLCMCGSPKGSWSTGRRMKYCPPCRKMADARYRERNRTALRVRVRAWEKANPEAVRAKEARKTPEAKREAMRRYLADPINRAKVKERTHQRRNAPGSFTAGEWAGRVLEFGGRCAYCIVADGNEVEHMRALSRGGSNSIDNIIPACRKCNRRKGCRGILSMVNA